VPVMSETLKTKLRAYEDAAKAASTPKANNAPILFSKTEETTIAPEGPSSPVESKMMDSPKSVGSLKDRMNAYQDAVKPSNSPKSPITGRPSLKERLSAYQDATSSSNLNKQVSGSPAKLDEYDEEVKGDAQ